MNRLLRDCLGASLVEFTVVFPVLILVALGTVDVTYMLFDWALAMAERGPEWHDAPPLAWDKEVARFHETLRRFDDYLASDAPLAVAPEKLFQGAIADSLTHIGQLAILRRLAGARMKSENYSRADIQAGRVGAAQSAPSREFD